MEELVKRRSILKGQLTRFETFLNDESNQTKTIELHTRLAKAEAILGNYEDIQYQIELLDNTDTQLTERETFEDSYYRVISKAKSLINKLNSTNDPKDSVRPIQTTQNQSPRLNLPILKLPTFDGTFDHWLSFFDMFSNIVHSNDTLNDIEKLHYLRSCLTGEALNVIASLDLISASYSIAWNLLQERYNNKPLIIQKHVNSLFNLPKLQSESVSELRKLFNDANKHIRSLKSLGEPTETWDTLLIHLITSKFDSVTFKEWQVHLKSDQKPNMVILNDFLNHRFNMLESMIFNQSQFNISEHTKQRVSINQNHHKHSFSESSIQHEQLNKFSKHQANCHICGNQHAIFQCNTFLKLTIPDRISKVKNLNMCTNCLKIHKGPCSSLRTCKNCNLRHNSLLCLKNFNDSTKPFSKNTIQASNLSSLDKTAILSTQGLNNTSQSHVLLTTVMLDIVANNGKYVTCRALLDSGSQANFLTETLCRKLQIKKEPANISVTGINCQSNSVTNMVRVTIRSRVTTFSTELDCLVLQKLTENLPSINLPDLMNIIPSHMQVSLADPSFNIPNKVDMILGAQTFWHVLCNNMIELSPCTSTILRETKLGWIITGTVNICTSNLKQIESYFVSTDTIDFNLQKFWELDHCQSESLLSSEEILCEQHYQNTTVRMPDGRYQVTIPFKEDISNLGDTKNVAIKRFFSLENRLIKVPHLYTEYKKFMQEYERLGHMECKGNLESSSGVHDTQTYFIPHHSVIKESSTTTKLRVVFDCSAKSSTGISFNDISMNGPRVQDDLLPILLRFRMHKYVFSADIEKMYRQVLVDPLQLDLQSIIWREDSSKPLKRYVLKTVTYGSKSAPFLATRTLHQLAKDEEIMFPEAAKVLLNDFYVDDVLSGSQSIQCILQLQQDLTDLLHKGGFHLRKWSSNLPDLLANIPRADVEVYPLHDFDNSNTVVKTLGLMWDTSCDSFKYCISSTPEKIVTKREVLSCIAKIFDPLGLIGPVILMAKLIMQNLWKEGIDWDKGLPDSVGNQWNNFYGSLSHLNNLAINRYVLPSEKTMEMEMHCFADASANAFGACIYIRCKDEQGNVTVNLLASRSRVAPLKVISLPRLELCAALLLTQLYQSILKSLSFNKDKVYFYSDSTIVLSWIQSSSSHYTTFVGNRVSKIQSHTCVERWNHVSSSDNPADIISRGCNAEVLLTSTLWWQGPLWLRQGHEFWREPNINVQLLDFHVLPEVKKQSVHVSLVISVNGIDIFSKYSSLERLFRVMAYGLRFCHNLRIKSNIRHTGVLTVNELHQSRTKLLQLAQSQSFSQEINELKRGRPIQKTSKLLQLNPFIDDQGLLRVGGRIQNSNLTPDQKHPVVLDHKHKFTRLIAEHLHKDLNHAGPQLLLSALRENYWPLNGRSLVRAIVHNCLQCFKAKPRAVDQLMGQLPQVRVVPSRPFCHTGCDFFGPLYIKTSTSRRGQLAKTYVALFICLSVKAIHLELVEDLTTESFLAALKRFISRRGKPVSINTDNAKTFIGADNELKELRELWTSQLHMDTIETTLANQGIKWSYIPPLSPNFGGLWESGVRLVKYHFSRVVQNTNLRMMEMITLLTQIEGCINSRPITLLASEPSDLVPLTPGHFLIGAPITSHPEPDLTSLRINTLSRWQYVQQLTQHFWKRWSSEYVTELQRLLKWNVEKPNIKVDDIVLVQEGSNLPCVWTLGRVIKVFTGQDNLVRVVTIKTKKGHLIRSITKVCPLPSNI